LGRKEFRSNSLEIAKKQTGVVVTLIGSDLEKLPAWRSEN
jgi:hypothetical protein